MDCLKCAEQSVTRSAVAICMLCSSGTCLQHRTQYDITIYSHQPGGIVPLRIPEPNPLRVSLCAACTDLMNPQQDDQPRGGLRATLLSRMAGYGRQVEEVRTSGRLAPGTST
ncbi:MAG: hypothetical protein KatS3mg057_2889 [Herpetosiphonaceae bacterium]|nr:MAG: hypothetical protein KatS3mg057_2889 [Herpetosiphonaceae bacterium]